MWRRHTWSIRHRHSFATDGDSETFLSWSFMNPKWPVCWWARKNRLKNTAIAKTHFYMFKNITDGCQIIFSRTKCLSRVLMKTKDCLGVLHKPCVSIYAISWAVTLGHNENAAWPVGWAKPPEGLREVSKIHCHPSENKPAFLKLWKVSVRFLRVTAALPKVVSQTRENWAGKDETPNPNDNLACCFWPYSLIIRNKLTWKYIRLINLSAPRLPKLPHPPTITPLLPSSPRLSRQPLCPLVSGHLAWQSFILTAPRERKGVTKRQRDWGYFDFQTGAPVLPRSSPLLRPLTSSSYLIPFSFLLNISLHHHLTPLL